MTRVLTALLILAMTVLPALGRRGQTLLDSLDAMLPVRHLYELDRRQAIDRARGSFERSSNDEDRYRSLRGLYEAYRSYRIDSALTVAEWRLNIARRLGDKSKIASATINLAEGYAKYGAPATAVDILDTLDESALEDYHRKYRNSVCRSAYSLLAETAVLGSDRVESLEKLRHYRDEAMKETRPGSRGEYTLKAERLMEAGMYREAVGVMEEADRLFSFREDAAMQYTLGKVYLAAGRRDKAVEALAHSAMLDIASGTKEYMSLILLASILFEDGDVERAFDYINCAFEDADFSKANIRAAEIMKNMPVIDRAFHAAREAADERTRRLAVGLGLLGALLLATLLLLARALRSNKRMLSTIGRINESLEVKNAALVRADSLKLAHINTLMKAYAGYIEKIRDSRKGIYRLLKTGSYAKAMDAVKSPKAEEADVAAFLEFFDEAFLSMFPDFVDKANALLREPIVLREPSRLTPELRVAALMRLGIKSTDEIASMLHYSAQTVYNLRSSLRSMSDLPKAEFESRIVSL